MSFKWKWKRLKYKIVKLLLSIRYFMIKKLVGKMPIIANCKVYDDVMEYNIGKTRTYKPCMFYNNHVVNFQKVAMTYVQEELGLKSKNIERSRNGAMALNMRKGV